MRDGLLFVIALGVALLSAGCGDDSGVGPQSVKDYKIYFADYDHPHLYYAYHSATNVVDSFTLPYSSDDGLAISPEGKWMYLYENGTVFVVNTDSISQVEEHYVGESGIGMSGGLVLSPDGTRLAVQGNDILLVVNIPDFTIAFKDSLTSINGVFAPDGNDYYCVAEKQSTKEFFALQIHFGSEVVITRRTFSRGTLFAIVPDPIRQRWYMLTQAYSELYLFQVYDLKTDSMIFEQSHCPGGGDLLMSSDGDYVLFSQPSTIFGECPPASYFTIYDPDRNAIRSQPSTVGIIDGQNPRVFPVGDMCFTPDGRILLGLAMWTFPYVFAYDMGNKQFVKCFFLGNDKELHTAVCQTAH